jgi:tetratricopeptide (TPR) repeat protein
MTTMFSLGQRIRELRMKLGMTQVDLAKELCTPSMISQIESDRARPSYKMLLSIAGRLDVPMEKLMVHTDLNLEATSAYKMARSLLTGKQYAAAITLLQELLDTPRTQVSTMDILYDLGECHFQLDHLAEAESVFKQVHELAILRQDPLNRVKALSRFGTIAARRDQWQLAVFHWRKALEEIEKMDAQDTYFKASLLHQLGSAQQKLGRTSEAIETFQACSDLLLGMDKLRDLADVYLGLAKAYRQADDLEHAAEYSIRSSSLYESLDYLLQTMQLKISAASMYARTGREQEAEMLLQQAVTKLETLGEKKLMGMAYVELAQLHFQKERLVEAKELCETASSLLPESHVGHATIHRLLGRVAEAEGNRAEAASLLQRAAEGFKRLGEFAEWDDTMYELAELYKQENDLMRSLRVMEEMRAFTRQTLYERGIAL